MPLGVETGEGMVVVVMWGSNLFYSLSHTLQHTTEERARLICCTVVRSDCIGGGVGEHSRGVVISGHQCH